MKVKDLIAALQKVDAELELLASAPDGGEPYAIGHVSTQMLDVSGHGDEIAVAVINILN